MANTLAGAVFLPKIEKTKDWADKHNIFVPENYRLAYHLASQANATESDYDKAADLLANIDHKTIAHFTRFEQLPDLSLNAIKNLLRKNKQCLRALLNDSRIAFEVTDSSHILSLLRCCAEFAQYLIKHFDNFLSKFSSSHITAAIISSIPNYAQDLLFKYNLIEQINDKFSIFTILMTVPSILPSLIKQKPQLLELLDYNQCQQLIARFYQAAKQCDQTLIGLSQIYENGLLKQGANPSKAIQLNVFAAERGNIEASLKVAKHYLAKGKEWLEKYLCPAQALHQLEKINPLQPEYGEAQFLIGEILYTQIPEKHAQEKDKDYHKRIKDELGNTIQHFRYAHLSGYQSAYLLLSKALYLYYFEEPNAESIDDATVEKLSDLFASEQMLKALSSSNRIRHSI